MGEISKWKRNVLVLLFVIAALIIYFVSSKDSEKGSAIRDIHSLFKSSKSTEEIEAYLKYSDKITVDSLLNPSFLKIVLFNYSKKDEPLFMDNGLYHRSCASLNDAFEKFKEDEATPGSIPIAWNTIKLEEADKYYRISYSRVNGGHYNPRSVIIRYLKYFYVVLNNYLSGDSRSAIWYLKSSYITLDNYLSYEAEYRNEKVGTLNIRPIDKKSVADFVGFITYLQRICWSQKPLGMRIEDGVNNIRAAIYKTEYLRSSHTSSSASEVYIIRSIFNVSKKTGEIRVTQGVMRTLPVEE